jgi:hypothetical protein
MGDARRPARSVSGVVASASFFSVFGRRKATLPAKDKPIPQQFSPAAKDLIATQTGDAPVWVDLPKKRIRDSIETEKERKSIDASEYGEPSDVDGLEELGEESSELEGEKRKNNLLFKAAALAVIGSAGAYAVVHRLGQDESLDDDPFTYQASQGDGGAASAPAQAPAQSAAQAQL